MVISIIFGWLIVGVASGNLPPNGYNQVDFTTWNDLKHQDKLNCLITGITGKAVVNPACNSEWFEVNHLNFCFNDTILQAYGTSREKNCLVIDKINNHKHHYHILKDYRCQFACVKKNDVSNKVNYDLTGQSKITNINVLKAINYAASDLKNKVYLKYAALNSDDTTSIWFVVPGNSNLSMFSNFSLSTSIRTVNFFNSERSLIIYQFIVQSEFIKSNKFKFQSDPNKESSFIHLEKNNGQGCFGSNSIFEGTEISENNGLNGKKFLVCGNGTIENIDITIKGMNDCTMIFINKNYVKCKNNIGSCEISDTLTSDNDNFTLNAEVNSPSNLLIITDSETKKHFCNIKCTINVKSHKSVKVVCPDGASKVFHLVNDLTEKCPLINNWMSSKLASAICRMSFRPWWTLVLIVWLIAGVLILRIVLDILDVLCVILNWITTKCKSKLGVNYDYCIYCMTRIEYDELKKDHEICSKNTCAYCRKDQKNKIKLRIHASDCEKRIDIIEKARKTEQKNWKKERTILLFRSLLYKKMTIRAAYFISILFIFSMVVTPSHANQFSPISDDWEIFKEELEECGTECWRTSDECECPKTSFKGSRVLLSKISPNSKVSGYFDINSTFEITESRKIVDMTFTNTIKTGTHLIVSGNSIVDLPIEVGTGLTWKIQNKDSSETKTLSIGIYEAAQVYNTVFKYYTADRKIERSQEFDCTGDCSEDCGCKSNTCLKRKYEYDRAWNCNPHWCWSINTGCTCCYAYATLTDSKYVFGIWDVSYINTELIMCLNYDHPKYTCFNIQEGGSFKIENFNLKLTKVFGIDKKLPKRIITVHKKHENSFDTEHPDKVLIDPDISFVSSATHGEVGDLSFETWEDLMKENSKNINMRWTGVSIDRSCSFAKMPVCGFQGIVEKNTELFENMIELSDHLQSEYTIITNSIDANQNYYALKVRPKKGSGILQMSLEVDNLELSRTAQKIELNDFKLIKCSGCRGCHTGFWCIMKISLKSPEKISLHVFSSDPDVVFEANNIIATNVLTTFNISGFVSTKRTSIDICIQEVNQCTSTENVALREPVKVLIAKRDILISTALTSTVKDNSWFENLFLGSKKFFLGLYHFLLILVTDWKLILLILSIAFLIYILFFTRIGKILLCLCPAKVIEIIERRKRTARSVTSNFSMTEPFVPARTSSRYGESSSVSNNESEELLSTTTPTHEENDDTAQEVIPYPSGPSSFNKYIPFRR